MTLKNILDKERIDFSDFEFLISKAAVPEMNLIALAAQNRTVRYFGRTVQLYAPLYISNECVNLCAYCGFNRGSGIKRVTLRMDQILEEAHFLKRLGFRHILILSGESREKVPVNRLKEIVSSLWQNFASIAIEVYPLSEKEYQEMALAGADGLTIYQETYHLPTYRKVHPSGPKKNFNWRIKTAERAARAGIRRIGLGALLGLYDWRYEAVKLAEHLQYLQKRFWRTQFQLSFPTLNPAETDFRIEHPVSDAELIQMISAFRLFFPQIGFVMSTRERPGFRDRIFKLGITQMSAGSKTSPGAYSLNIKGGKQFEIADKRSVKEVARAIKRAGYDPVYKDWEMILK